MLDPQRSGGYRKLLSPTYVLLLAAAVIELAAYRLGGAAIMGYSVVGAFAYYCCGTLAFAATSVTAISNLRSSRGWAFALLVFVATATVVQLVAPGVAWSPNRWHAVVACVVIVTTWLATPWCHPGVGLRLLGLTCLAAAAAVWFAGTDDGLAQLSTDVAAARRAVIRLAAVVAVLSPYLLTPRPFARVTRAWLPALIACALTFGLAVVLRTDVIWGLHAAEAISGLSFLRGQLDPFLWFYLLALGAITWTLVTCWRDPAYRAFGIGLALMFLGGLLRAEAVYQLLWLAGASLAITEMPGTSVPPPSEQTNADAHNNPSATT